MKSQELFEELKSLIKQEYKTLINDEELIIYTEKEDGFRNLIIDPFNQNSKEWSLKIVHHLNSTSFDEIINNIITIDRIQGQMSNQNKIKEFDDIKVSMDINTDDKTSSLRFNIENAFSFFKEAIVLHDNTLSKIEEKIKVSSVD